MVTTTRIKKMLGIDLDQAKEVLTEFATSHPQVGLFYAVENSTEDGTNVSLIERRNLATTDRAHLYAVKKRNDITLDEENGPLELKQAGREYAPLVPKQQTLDTLWGIKEMVKCSNDSASKCTINASRTTQTNIRNFLLPIRKLEPRTVYELALSEEFRDMEEADSSERSAPSEEILLEDMTGDKLKGNGIESAIMSFWYFI